MKKTSVFFLLTCAQLFAVDSFVLNTDPNYPRWPGRTIPYYLQPGDYSDAETQIIKGAMLQISSDLGNAFTFTERFSTANNGQPFVIISKSGTAGSRTPAATCATFPGMVYNQNGVGQFVAMVGGPDGCLGSIRQAMRILVHLMGLRSEYRKPVIPGSQPLFTVNNQVVRPAAQSTNALAPYASNVVLSNTAIDYNSVTLLDDQTFTTSPGQSVITPRDGQPMFNSGRLSLQDCQALQFLYSITSPACQNPFLNGNIPPANQQGGGGGGTPDVG